MNAAVSLALDKLEKSLALYVNEAFAVERNLSPEQDHSPRRAVHEGETESPTGKQDKPGIHEPDAYCFSLPGEEAAGNSHVDNYGTDKRTPALENAAVSDSLPYTSKVQPLYLRIAAMLIGVIMWAVILVLIAFCFPSVFGSYIENLSIYAQQLARFLPTYAP